MTSPVPVVERSRTASLRLLRADPIRLLEDAATYGDLVRVPMPRVRVYIANHPDLAWDVLSTGNRDFRKSAAARAMRRVLGDGLLTSEGEVHDRQRRLLQPIFHHERIDGYGAAMVAEAERWSEGLEPGQRVEMHRAMGALTLAVVGRTLFGADVGSREAARVGEAMDRILAQFGRQFSPWFAVTSRLPLPSTRRLDRSIADLDRVVASLIERRRAAGGGGDDLLSRLLAAGAGQPMADQPMTDRQLRDEAITLLLAGHETTAGALTWTWWLLSGHPEAAARLHAELRQAGLGDRPPAAADLPGLPYLRAVVSESLRLRPPAWAIGREAISPHDLGGAILPEGSVAIVSPWLLHRDPRWWPEPLAFRPERWLEPDPDRPRHAYLPFGGGPRVCVGEGFARMETALLVAALARRWRFELDPAARVELLPVVTLRPRYGMPMRAVPATERGREQPIGFEP